MNDLKLPSGKKLPCLEGWKLNINSLLLLWEDLNVNYGFRFLLTNRLNQDCVENMFSIIRGKGGNRDNPNAEQFRGAFRSIIVQQLLVPSSSSNCQVDLDKVLLDISSLSKRTDERIHEPNNAENVPVATETIGLFNFVSNENDQIPTKNVTAYVSGYLLRKVGVTCESCKSMLIEQSVPANNELYMFIKEKAYKEQGTLVYPSEKMIEMLFEIEQYYQINIPNVLHLNNVMHRLFNIVSCCMDGVITCPNQKCKEKLICAVKLYIKLRLHASLKRANFAYLSSGYNKRNRKVLKLMNL